MTHARAARVEPGVPDPVRARGGGFARRVAGLVGLGIAGCFAGLWLSHIAADILRVVPRGENWRIGTLLVCAALLHLATGRAWLVCWRARYSAHARRDPALFWPRAFLGAVAGSGGALAVLLAAFACGWRVSDPVPDIVAWAGAFGGVATGAVVHARPRGAVSTPS